MLFVDEHSQVDKEALRVFGLARLDELAARVERVVHGSEAKGFWERVGNLIVANDGKDKEAGQKALEAVLGLSKLIASWRRDAVESSERFEFFIQTKANEISSGDQQKDYFWALQIRHDQLVAVIEVVGKAVELIETWRKMAVDAVVGQTDFLALANKGWDRQIFEEAEAIHKRRESKRG